MVRLGTVCWLALTGSSLAFGRIDRRRIVSQHNIVRTRLIDNGTTPLQVGNGNFAFSVDITGMQTYLPFNTMSTWAWHNDSLPTNGEEISDYQGVPMMTHGRNVFYDIPDPDLPEISQWLIGNPNRINLGRIGLKYRGDTLAASQITEPRQELDLWTGVIKSTFKVDGRLVEVTTRGDFETDTVAFDIESKLVRSGDLKVELDFPYPPIHTTKYKYEVFAGVYDFPLNHTTTIVPEWSPGSAHIYHELQETSYFVNLRWPLTSPLKLSRDEPEGSDKINAHRYTLGPAWKGFWSSPTISFTARFSPEKEQADLPLLVKARNHIGWENYWSEGGFVDLTSSSNPNATELQRRIVQSQYHVRVNSASKGQTPQESGLMNNGWYELLRWPKMTELITGRSSPGGINGLLLWQQPHPMYLAELAYQAKPTRETLMRWDRVLSATADYMASYAWKNETTGKYDLGPPSYGVTENTPPSETRNLAYEIAYWRYGLDVACAWKKKLHERVPQKWTTVAENLALPPQVDGLYAVYDGLNSSWWENPKLTGDPRSLIMMQGILPDTPAVDPEVALRTADKVWDVWGDTRIRGWGRPILAINSARIGNPERAIYHLTAYSYWIFDDAGFAVRGGDGGTPPPFMPGNAGFLYAATPSVPASLAFECLQSVPNKPEPAAQLVTSLKAYVEWQSTLAWLKDPPSSYMLPPVDIQARLDNISATAVNGGYASEYEFQLAIFQTVVSAHDGHFSYRPDVFKAFSFRNGLAADLISVSRDGKELPKLYHRAAFAPDATAPPVAVTQINGRDAVEFLSEMSLKFSSFQDVDSQWNSQFPTYANPEATLVVAGSLAYQGESFTFTYENGDEKTETSVAVLRDGVDFDGVDSGEDFYDRFCNPDSARATTPAAPKETSTTTPAAYPKPVVSDSGANETSGYFLNGTDYDDVAVLAVSSFAGDGVEGLEYLTNFQEVVASFLEKSRQAEKKRLVIDLTANGGGFVIAGFELFAQLFPGIKQYGANNMRLADSLVDIARVIETIPEDSVPATQDEFLALRALAQSSIISNVLPRGVFTPEGQRFGTVEDILGPVSLHDDLFTAYQNAPLNMPGTDFNLTGSGDRSNPPQAVFAPENVVLLTDGTCGSTCTIFSYLMILEAGVKTVAVGGSPRPGPMQAIAGVEGAQVFFFRDIAAAASAALVLAPAERQAELAAGQLGTLAQGYAIRRAADPANAGAVNGKNAFGRADVRTPFQFLYEPANCRFFYTAEMLDRPELVWMRAVDATWTDPDGFCVEDSRVPANGFLAVDPIFPVNSSDSRTGMTGQAGDPFSDATDSASFAGGSSDDTDSDSAAERALKGGQGYRALVVALLTTATWFWITP
ncbi:hypothetical protein DL765_006120 [Monosporascus sp. GIB2]|nr:hypothetical protein DL765_006120 [Monosporascus sp. GIB2]